MRTTNDGRLALRGVVLVSVFAAAMAGSSCRPYQAEGDKINLQSGDAVEINKVTHTINPWPRASRNARIDQNGERAAGAYDRYRKNEAAKAAATPAPTSSVSPADPQ